MYCTSLQSGRYPGSQTDGKMPRSKGAGGGARLAVRVSRYRRENLGAETLLARTALRPDQHSLLHKAMNVIFTRVITFQHASRDTTGNEKITVTISSHAVRVKFLVILHIINTESFEVHVTVNVYIAP